MPPLAKFAVSHYDGIQNQRQNQIFDDRIQHHQVNYYKFSGTCTPRNANIIQFGNFNETLMAELEHSKNRLQQLNENIGRLNSPFSGLSTTDRQRINYFLPEMMRVDYNAIAIEIR